MHDEMSVIQNMESDANDFNQDVQILASGGIEGAVDTGILYKTSAVAEVSTLPKVNWPNLKE